MYIRIFLSLVLAVLVSATAPDTFAQQLLYIHADHLNTPRLVTNGSGVAVWRWDQTEPFGDNLPNEDPDGNGTPGHMPLRFPGQYFDKETNLHYNNYRDYDSNLGRYIQSDPIGLLGSLNTYLYVEANSLDLSDPDGLTSRGERGASGGAAGQHSNTPHKRCRELDPPETNFVECKHHQTGKWVKVRRPPGMPFPSEPKKSEMCDVDCQSTAVWVVGAGGVAYLTYRCIRMLPSLIPPLWPTIIPNLVTP